MAFCGKCGSKLENDTKFCPACGASTEVSGSDTDIQRQTGYAYTSPVAPGMHRATAVSDAQDNKVMAILAYFGPLVLVPIFAAKESRFARYHANQGLVLLLLCLAFSIVYRVLSSIILAISWKLVFISSAIGFVGGIGITVLAVIGIINAAKGETKPLPVIGNITLLK